MLSGNARAKYPTDTFDPCRHWFVFTGTFFNKKEVSAQIFQDSIYMNFIIIFKNYNLYNKHYELYISMTAILHLFIARQIQLFILKYKSSP